MSLKKMFSKMCMVAVMLAGISVQASELKTFKFTPNFRVNDSATESLNLKDTYYVKNLIIQAEGISTDSTIEVVVNGQTKGTIFAPGSDPSYVVTVEEETSSIQFRHRSGGAMRILDVVIVMSDVIEDTFSGVYTSNKVIDDVNSLASATIHLVEVISPFATLVEQKDYLLPIKIKAANVVIMNDAHGALSMNTRKALLALQAEIQKADPYITTLLEQEAFFDLGVDFLTIKETIKELLY